MATGHTMLMDRQLLRARITQRHVMWVLLAVTLICGATPAVAGSPPAPRPGDSKAPATLQARPVTALKHDNRLPMEITGRALRDLLDELTQHSGIRFNLTPSLATHSVTTTLSGPSWNDAIKGFLRSYNHLAIVDRDGTLRRVWITGFDAPAASTAQETLTAETHDNAGEPFATRPDSTSTPELPLALWQPARAHVEARRDLPAEPIEADPQAFENLTVGQPLELAIPQEASPVFGVVSETHDQLGGAVRVWSGPVDGSHDSASFTISRGATTTYITVATGTNIYEVSVDNETGEGSVVNEVDMTRGKTDNDIVLPPESKGEHEATLPSLN